MRTINATKIILIISTFFLGISNVAFSQECVCNDYLNYIYDYTKIKKTENFQESFKQWFFSEQFEQDETSSETSIDITVPIYDVPVDFGYGHESKDAWKKWRENKGSTHWDFSRITASNVFLKVATPQARQVYLECVQSQCNTKFPVIYKILPSGGIALTIGYNANLFDKAPIITDFACQGLDCNAQSTKYKNKPLKKGAGETIIFNWGKNNFDKGTITVNTNQGSSITIPVNRTILANLAKASWTTVMYGDSSKLDESELETHFSGYLINNGMQETNWYPGCMARSNDGKFCAVVIPFSQQPVEHKYFRNLQCKCVDELGFSCGWSAPLGEPAPRNDIYNGPYLQFWTKNWGPKSKWNFSMDVYSAKKTYGRKEINSAIQNASFSFIIPKSVANLWVTVYLADQKTIAFDPLVAQLPDRIHLDSKTDDALSTTYNYTLLPSK